MGLRPPSLPVLRPPLGDLVLGIALPVPDPQLPEAVVDDRLTAEQRRERCRRLHGTSERARHKPVDRLLSKDVGDRRGGPHPSRLDALVEPTHRPALAVRGLRLAHEVAQGALTDHGNQGPADRLVRLLHGGGCQSEEDAVLAADAFEVVGQRLLHALLGGGVDLVHEADQQVDQRVGDLALTLPTQRAQQREADRHGRGPQVRRIQPRRAGAPSVDQLLRAIGKQVGWQLEPADGRKLVDLPQQDPHPNPSRIGLQLRHNP